MRTLSQQEMTAVSGGCFLFCLKPVKKPVCVKLPKPPKTHGCNPKPPCGEPETPDTDPAPAG